VSTVALTDELSAITVSTRRFVGVSVAVHALILLWMLLYKAVAAPTYGLTEITWVEPEPVVAPEPAAPPVAREKTPEAPVQRVAQKPAESPEPQHFVRELPRAEVAPEAQSRTVDDVLSQRLASLQSETRRTETSLSALVPPPRVGVPAVAGVPADVSAPSVPTELDRSTRGTQPTALTRMEAGQTPSAAMPAVAVPETRASAAVDASASSAARDLAGARLVGPVADRALLSSGTPAYPEWAKREGVEATVTLYFFVLPDGRVKENILVEKTSGFSDFDGNAVSALGAWRFETLRGPARDQWGRITFHFRLSGNL
jgi:TonB family protein